MDATEIIKQLRARIEAEPRVDPHRDRIDITLDADGVVTLAGEVADIASAGCTWRPLTMPATVGNAAGRVRRLGRARRRQRRQRDRGA